MPDFDLFIANRTVASMEGQQVSFSEDDLRGIAERYDPALHEAPLIIGHPQHDAPAYGWVKALSFADGRLQANEHQLIPEFAAARDSGSYKKISARFFAPDSPNNPTPGHYYLRDVGFLGALTPAVKGLRTYSFGDDADHVVVAELSFADMPAHSGSAIARLFGRLRDWLITESGTDAAENQRLKTAQAQNEAQARHAENLSFADGLVEAGRWPSGHRDMLVATLDHLSQPAAGGCVSFGDGDAAQPLHQALRQGLQELPLLVSFGDVATKEKAAAGKVQSDRAIADKARAYKEDQAKAGNHISFGDAVNHVTGEAQ